MKILPRHYNPKETKFRSSCGRWLRLVRWTSDIKDVECDRCLVIELSKSTDA